MFRRLFFTCLLCSFFIYGCGGGSTAETPDVITDDNIAPSLSGSPTVFQKAGSYSFIPSASDMDGDVMTFAAQNLPAWAALNSATGEISGAAEAGVFDNIILTVNDSRGGSASLPAFSIKIINWAVQKTGVTDYTYEGEDGMYQNGLSPEFSKSGNIVYDGLNALFWQDDSAVSSVSYRWQEAADYCASLELDGYSDWRLPTLKEMETVIDYAGTGDYTIDTFENGAAGTFWTSDSDASDDSRAWLVNFSAGSDIFNSKTGNLSYARCVRSDFPYTAADLARDDTTGIITDKNTSLMWQDTAEAATNYLSWNFGMAYCEALDLGGYADWRLPNIRELKSIMVRTDKANGYMSRVFLNRASGEFDYYISSTPYLNGGYYRAVRFQDYYLNWSATANRAYVRCVRGQQP